MEIAKYFANQVMPFSSKFSSGTRCDIGFGEKALGRCFCGQWDRVCVGGGEEVIIAGCFFDHTVAKNMGGFCDVANKEGWFSCKMFICSTRGERVFATPFFTTDLSSALL